jgi:hypothetical protein
MLIIYASCMSVNLCMSVNQHFVKDRTNTFLLLTEFVVSIQTLSALENAIEPYLNAGNIITSQPEVSIALRAPARRFSWVLFLLSLFIV